MAVKLPNIMSGPITFEKILSIKVLQWLIIVVGFKIEGIDELEEQNFKTHCLIMIEEARWASKNSVDRVVRTTHISCVKIC